MNYRRWPRRRLKGVLRVGPDDVLVLHFDGVISMEQAARVREQFNAGGIKVVVTSKPLQIVAVQEGPNAST